MVFSLGALRINENVRRNRNHVVGAGKVLKVQHKSSRNVPPAESAGGG